MLKIMLSAVGTHDPYGYSTSGKDGEHNEGPILGAVRDLKPDILFLFPTRKQPDGKLSATEENSRSTTEEIKKLYPSIKVYERPIDLPDPTDYKRIIKILREEIDSVKKNYEKSKVSYYVAISSGTPQIHSSFLILVNSNSIKAEVYQTINSKFLQEGQKRTRLVETHFLEEENQIVRARKFFDSINYAESADELFNLACYTIYPERAQKAEVYYDLIRGYFYWDLYQHKKALENISKAGADIKRFGFRDLHENVSEQIDVLQKIIELGQKEDYLNLLDLYHNAARREKCCHYVECLSRYKRLYEGAYYYIARAKLGINNPSADIRNQPEWVRNRLGKGGHLNVHDISELYKYKVRSEIIPSSLEQKLNQFGQQRNYTINNHGMNSVEETDARKSLELLQKLFKHVFSNKNIQDYCFSLQTMKHIKGLIFDNL